MNQPVATHYRNDDGFMPPEQHALAAGDVVQTENGDLVLTAAGKEKNAARLAQILSEITPAEYDYAFFIGLRRDGMTVVKSNSVPEDIAIALLQGVVGRLIAKKIGVPFEELESMADAFADHVVAAQAETAEPKTGTND